MMEDSSASVMFWWATMSAIAAVNLILLIITYKTWQKRMPGYSSTLQFVRKWQFALAAIYTIGCGFRSVFPREDLERVVLINSWISSVVIGRSVATIAEVSFVAQWAFILYEIGKGANNRFALSASKILVPIIIVAECFSWYACTTSNYIGSTVEESLWTITAAIALYAFIKARPLYNNQQKRFLTGAIISATGYVIYMATVDVPNYLCNFLANQAAGKNYPTFKQGFYQISTQWRTTHAYADWKYAMIWMTLYFSVAVWASMYIVNGPVLVKNVNR